MKTIKFYRAKGFKSGHEYELKESGSHFVVVVGNKRKVLTLEFLRRHSHEFGEYNHYAN
jgi:ribosomal protein L6P/L9E